MPSILCQGVGACLCWNVLLLLPLLLLLLLLLLQATIPKIQTPSILCSSQQCSCQALTGMPACCCQHRQTLLG
jgi:hypothetical protein